MSGAGSGSASGSGSGSASGSGGTGVASGGSGSPVNIVPATCGNITTLPAAAPALQTGVWTRISPSGVNFHSDGKTDTFTQGITVDPCNAGTLYLSVCSFDVAHQSPGVYKSVDAGSTWKKVGSLDEPIHVRIDPKDPNHLYAADGVRGNTNGLWVSRDGGLTWGLPAGFTALSTQLFQYDAYDVAADPADFNHVLVTSHSPWNGYNQVFNAKWGQDSGVLESKDGGNNWTLRGPQVGWSHGNGIWFLSDSNTWLLGSQADGYWRTGDGGATWTQVVPASCNPSCDVGNNMQHGGGQVFRAASGVYYGAGVPHLMRTRDDGLTWTLLGPSGGYNSIMGDGTNLYAAPNTEPGPLGPGFITATVANDTTWTEYPGGTVLTGGTGAAGPFEMTFDSANGIVYAACWSAGLWALKVH
jgi:hypothetical protein